jgi:NTE family protein
VLLTPDVGDVGYIDFDHKRRAIAAGVESARAALPRIRAALAAWHPHARRAGASP